MAPIEHAATSTVPCSMQTMQMHSATRGTPSYRFSNHLVETNLIQMSLRLCYWYGIVERSFCELLGSVW